MMKQVVAALLLLVFQADPARALSAAQKLLADDGAAGDMFGCVVALSGNTALIGARYDDGSKGAAYIFTRQKDGSWKQTQKLTASDGMPNENFGSSVAISGDTALVGAGKPDPYPAPGQGSVYVFVRSGGVWTQQAKIVDPDGDNQNEFFAQTVALEGDTALIGAVHDDNAIWNDGTVYVFVRSGGVWTQQAKLFASDGAAGDNFGCSLVVQGDTAMISARLHDHDGAPTLYDGKGAVYVFERSGGVWTQKAELTASDSRSNDTFGSFDTGISLSGNTAVIGAPFSNDKGVRSGSAYVFERSGGVWTQKAKLFAEDGAANSMFGNSVALENDTVVIGSENGASNAAYVFMRSAAGEWTQQTKLTASDGAAGDFFGYHVALNGGTVLVSAQRDDDQGAESGSAYIFGKGNTYQQFDTPLTWNAAKTACEGIGAHLATITSQPENDLVVSAMTAGAVSAWIGGTDQPQEGNWQWITGEPWSYANWNSGEPNDTSGGEDYLEIIRSQAAWNDFGGPGFHGSMARFYVCEWEAACVAHPSDMVNWWPGDGNAKDIIGGQHGAVIGSAGFAPGKMANAFSFDGNGGYIAVADSPALTLGDDDFTIELWVRFNSLSGRDPFIAHDNSPTGVDKWIFFYDQLGHDKQVGVPALRFHIVNNSTGAILHDAVVAPWNPATGQWYHVAVTRSGAAYALYINGALAATDTSTYALPDPVVPLTIGAAEAFRLNGSLDEVGIYKRALSAAEIEAIYNVGHFGKCKDMDNDGIDDYADNCPAAVNPGQEDKDEDGIGDTCDLVSNIDMAPAYKLLLLK